MQKDRLLVNRKKLSQHLGQCLLVRSLGALQQLDGILCSDLNGRLDANMMTELFNAQFHGRHRIILLS